MPTHISLPNERVEQLRMIARAKHATIPEIIAGFVRGEIDAGTIPATLPGIDVAPVADAITITAGKFSASVPMSEGPALANLLKCAGGVTADPVRKRDWYEGLAGLSGMKVMRAGNGLKLVSPVTGRALPLNLDVAADLGEQVASAVK